MISRIKSVRDESDGNFQPPIQQRDMSSRVLMLGLSVMLVIQIIISWIALDGFEVEFEPQLNQKTIAVGRAVSRELSYAVGDLGITPNQLYGMSDYFDALLESNPDIEFLALLDQSSRIIFTRNVPKLMLDDLQRNVYSPDAIGRSYSITRIGEYITGFFPIYSMDKLIGVLNVGVSHAVTEQHIFSIFIEVGAVILVSMFVAMEFLVMFVNQNILAPTTRITTVLSNGVKGIFANRLAIQSRNEIGRMVGSLNRLLYHLEQRYQDSLFELRELEEFQTDKSASQEINLLGKQMKERYSFSDTLGMSEKNPALIRIPLFLFIFSEELSRSFFPLFVSGFIPRQTIISYEMMVGLPITLFMAATFVATLFAGGLIHRLGCSRLFLVGIVCAFIGYFGTFLSQGYIELVASRCLNGIGYGLIFNACETWIALHARSHNRARSASSFVGAVFAGLVCGPPLGGMFADYLGAQTTFLVSAGLALISGYTAYRLLSARDKSERTSDDRHRMLPRAQDWAILFRSRRFIGVALTAVSTKMTVSAFLFFIIPLYLNKLGFSNSQIGQMLMLYGMLAVIGTPLVARGVDQLGNHQIIVSIGSAISGFGLLVVLGGGASTVLIAIIAIGIGHCLILSPQNAIVQQIARQYRFDIEISVALSIYRFVDRSGMVIGPILAAILVQELSYVGAIVSIGCIVIFATALALVINRDARGSSQNSHGVSIE